MLCGLGSFWIGDHFHESGGPQTHEDPMGPQPHAPFQTLSYIPFIWLLSSILYHTLHFKNTHLGLACWPTGFPGGSVVKNPPADAGVTGLITDPGRSHVLRSN